MYIAEFFVWICSTIIVAFCISMLCFKDVYVYIQLGTVGILLQVTL